MSIKLKNILGTGVPTPEANNVILYPDSGNNDYMTAQDQNSTVYDLTASTADTPGVTSEIMIMQGDDAGNTPFDGGINYIWFIGQSVLNYRTNFAIGQYVNMTVASLIVDGDEKIVSPQTYVIDVLDDDARWVGHRWNGDGMCYEIMGASASSSADVRGMTPIGYLNFLNEIGLPYGIKFTDRRFQPVILGPDVDWSVIIQREFLPGPNNGFIIEDSQYRITYTAGGGVVVEYDSLNTPTSWSTMTYNAYSFGVPHIEQI